MFTSYYAKSGSDPRAISISAKAPDWFVGRRYTPLAPTWGIINAYKVGSITKDQYRDKYLNILIDRKLTPTKVLDDLGDDAILLCYETPTDFCHRHIVAEWITNETGIIVRELSMIKPDTIVDSCFEF